MNIDYNRPSILRTTMLFVIVLSAMMILFSGCGASDGSNDSGRTLDPDETDDDPSPGGQGNFPDDDTPDDDDDNDDNNDNDDNSLDPDEDEDHDGISNGQEITDGTDPLDPSDALAWHPEIGPHPRLIADAQRWADVRQAIENGDPDAVRLFSRVKSAADLTPGTQQPGVYDFSIIERNGWIASSAALAAYVLDNPAYADKAIQMTSDLEVRLLDLPLQEFDQGTIHGGQAFVTFCLAYDLLVGFGFADETQAAAMERAIRLAARRLHAFYVLVPIGQFVENNHIIKFTSGLFMVGLTFNQNEEAARYTNIAMTTAPFVLLDFQMPEGGGQGEGPNYLDYTFKTYLFFAAAYHRFAQGRAYPYLIDCRTRFWPPCKPEIVDIEDPVVDPRMELLLDWRLSLVMPDGRCPPIDDANLSCGYSGPVAALYDRTDYAWHYRTSQRCTENTSDLAMLELALLDRMPLPQPPEYGPTLMNEDAGQAMLRTGWDENAHYALVNGEHGKARLAGLGHEQPDATSFIFYALGEFFAIDSGYISWDERWHVIHARNHSMILVDDRGPTLGLYWAFAGVDSYLSELVVEPFFRSVRVDSAYQGADVTRRVMLIDDDYYVTSDWIESDRVRTFAWLMQTNAGGTTDGSFTLESKGALIERPKAVMRSHLQCDAGSLFFLQDEEEHGFRHGQLESHAVLRAEVDSASAGFLGIHTTAETPAQLPDVETFQSPSGNLIAFVHGEDYLDTVVFSARQDIVLQPQVGRTPGLRSDASYLWLRAEPNTLRLVRMRRIGGTYAIYGSMPEKQATTNYTAP